MTASLPRGQRVDVNKTHIHATISIGNISQNINELPIQILRKRLIFFTSVLNLHKSRQLQNMIKMIFDIFRQRRSNRADTNKNLISHSMRLHHILRDKSAWKYIDRYIDMSSWQTLSKVFFLERHRIHCSLNLVVSVWDEVMTMKS